MILLALIIRTLNQLVIKPLYLGLQVMQIFKSSLSLLSDSACIGQFHYLRQITYCHLLGYGYSARCRLLQSGNNLKHGRFARTVLTHQGNTVLVTYHVADVMKQGAGPELNLKILYRKHFLLSKQLGGIYALLYKICNLIDHTLTVLCVCNAKPLGGGVKHLNGSSTVIYQFIHHERNEIL